MRIVIAEDQLLFRETICQVCEREFGYKVIGQTSSGAVAAEMVARLKPDILILDLSLEEWDGFRVADEVRNTSPQTAVLVLSSYDNQYTVFRLEQLAIRGFVDKSSGSVDVLRRALQALAVGKTYFSESFRNARRARQLDARSFAKVLSPTEHEVLGLIAKGLDDAEIARECAISPCTAQTHRSKIMRKLQIRGTPKLIAYAIEHGFVFVK